MTFRKTKFIQILESNVDSVLNSGYYKCAEHPEWINVGTADNALMADFLLPVLQTRTNLTEFDLNYFGGMNSTKLKEGFASLFQDHFGIKDVLNEQITFGTGCAHLIEKIGLVFCEPGDVILIPKPCYGAFEPDLVLSQGKVHYIDLDDLPDQPPQNARLLILTNPGNPIGDFITNGDQIFKWALQNQNIHIIVDEVYALSGRNNKPFQSLLTLETADPNRVHLVYGLSKDWGLAGYFFGIFFSRNSEINHLIELSMGCFSMPGDVKRSLENIFCNKSFRDEYIIEFRKRLTQAEQSAYEKFTELGIETIRSEGSLFLLLNLKAIAGDSEENELKVYNLLMNDYQVHLLPAKIGFRYKEYGWFRFCFSTNQANVAEAIKRIGIFLQTFPK